MAEYNQSNILAAPSFSDYASFWNYLQWIEDPYHLVAEVKRGFTKLSVQENSDIASYLPELADYVKTRMTQQNVNPATFATHLALQRQQQATKCMQIKQMLPAKRKLASPSLKTKRRWLSRIKGLTYLWLIGGILLSVIISGIVCAFLAPAWMLPGGAICGIIATVHLFIFLSTLIARLVASRIKQHYQKASIRDQQRYTENDLRWQHSQQQQQPYDLFHKLLEQLLQKLPSPDYSQRSPFYALRSVKRSLKRNPRAARDLAFNDIAQTLLADAEKHDEIADFHQQFLSYQQREQNKCQAIEQRICYLEQQARSLAIPRSDVVKIRLLTVGKILCYVWMVSAIIGASLLCSAVCPLLPAAWMMPAGSLCALLVAAHGLVFLTTHIGLKILSSRQRACQKPHHSLQQRLQKTQIEIKQQKKALAGLMSFNRLLHCIHVTLNKKNIPVKAIISQPKTRHYKWPSKSTQNRQLPTKSHTIGASFIP